MSESLLQVRPSIVPPLDETFEPCVLGAQNYIKNARASANHEPLIIGLERGQGFVSRYETVVFSQGSPYDADTLRYAERLVKFLLWARGGGKVFIGGPSFISAHIEKLYTGGKTRAFDAQFMGQVFERTFTVVNCRPSEVPPNCENAEAIGGNLDGCRIGFDLGASDYKVSAVIDGQAVYTDEFPWNPKIEADPEYHYNHLTQGLKQAASRMPRVDAIGGSSAGIIIKSRVRAASLFRAVPQDKFSNAVAGIFERVARDWNVPVVVVNDGDVTALAGALSLKQHSMLGIAMGSSLAAGFLDVNGLITGWLNELAFAPVDNNQGAPEDEWSGDIGCGVQYFSQQSVGRLAQKAGLHFDPTMGLPEVLKEVQALMSSGDARALQIYQTIGVYLGYTIAWWSEFYDFRNILILGRVTTGKGGEVIIEEARRVLSTIFPETYQRVNLCVPDEKSRRVGQAVAAASLPILAK
ncbi:MAG: ROK family protein [Verrucomicrobiota bacterium]|nr:ROK family protein [Verrucomicrobiota bacterium]